LREVEECLAVQHAELGALLSVLAEDAWSAPVPACPGWDVADVVLHLAQSDAAAVASAQDRFGEAVLAGTGVGGASVDDVADSGVAAERGLPPAQLLARWRDTAAQMRTALAASDPSARLRWVAGTLSARTLTTTRLAESWIHTGDILEALGLPLTADDRLWHIARLAWRTIPYAFERAGRAPAGPVTLDLRAPDGDGWLLGDGATPTTIRGTALDFCLVAGRRRTPDQTTLTAEGPDGAAILELVRTYA
jgi:uncharacterized protein (TIGR03084 family)